MSENHETHRDFQTGRYFSWPKCDCCGKPVDCDGVNSNWHTDYDVCGDSDGPGFYCCGRVRCDKRTDGLDVESRRELYLRQREENDRAYAESRKPRTVSKER
jgi:hypothetical protein